MATDRKDSELHMWSYWRGKYDIEEAAETYFPKLFQSDPLLWVSLAQYKAAALVIEARMKQLIEEKDAKDNS